MIIPKESRIDFLAEHTVEYYLEIFEGTLGMANSLGMTNLEQCEMLYDIIMFRMIKILEDHCE